MREIFASENIQHNWGADTIESGSRDLPALKFQWVMQALGEMPTGKILEIGCNGGRFLKSLSQKVRSLNYYGCDSDVDAVRRASSFEELNLCVADGCRLPFPDSSFDYVLVVDYLEHVPDYVLAVEEISRVLVPEGKLIAFVPCEGEKYSAYHLHRTIFRWDVKAKTCGHFPLRRKELSEMLNSRGLKIRSSNFSYHFFGQLMDFCFFWLVAKSPKVSEWWWSKNKYYFKGRAREGIASKLSNYIISLANLFAYLESRVLWNSAMGATGWHVVANKDPFSQVG